MSLKSGSGSASGSSFILPPSSFPPLPSPVDLFAGQRQANLAKAQPLAARMRARSLDEFVGQTHFLGDGMLLRRLIDADRLGSALFYGPPGTGKTTLARIIADTTASRFAALNAVSSGVKEVRKTLDDARAAIETGGSRTLLFLDEIHRFNKSQQDVLLGDVEDGVIILIGATTENPFFAVNSALVSRSQIFQFQPLSEEDVKTVIRRAVSDQERGFGGRAVELTDEALDHWAATSDGDARRALSALEVAVLSHKGDGPIVIDLAVAEQSIQRKAVLYDKLGDQHYDHASALIKSMRGSDPDAAVYWLARMLEAGEDPRFLARRLVIFASEDVGLADPSAMLVANAAFDVVTRVGLPECRLTLAHAVLHLATAPKSRSATTAIARATRDVQEARTVLVPDKLRDAHYRGSKRLGHGKASDEDDDSFGVTETYYEPSGNGRDVDRSPVPEPKGDHQNDG